MRKIFFFFIFFLSISSISSGQCFKPKSSFGDIRFGLGIQHFRFTDVTNNIAGMRDKSTSFEYPFESEYGIFRWLGVSLYVSAAIYKTSNSAFIQSGKSLELMPSINIHAPFGWNKFDLYGSVGYGLSYFGYDVHSPVEGKAGASGGVLNMGLTLRWLFKTDGRYGMNLWYKYSSYNCNKGTITDNNGNKTNFKLDGPGNSFGIGIFFRSAK